MNRIQRVLWWLSRHSIGSRIVIEMADYVEQVIAERNEAISAAVLAEDNLVHWQEKTWRTEKSLDSSGVLLGKMFKCDRFFEAMKFFAKSVEGEPSKKSIHFRVESKYLMTAETESLLLSSHPSKSLDEIVGFDSITLDFMWNSQRTLLISPESSAILEDAMRHIESVPVRKG